MHVVNKLFMIPMQISIEALERECCLRQIALFVVPFSVLVGWCIDRPFAAETLNETYLSLQIATLSRELRMDLNFGALNVTVGANFESELDRLYRLYRLYRLD